MANVLFKRGNTATINSTAITDGQLLWDTTTGQHYIDNESTRVEIGKPVVNTMGDVIAITANNIPCGTKPVKELNNNLDIVTNSLMWKQFASTTGTVPIDMSKLPSDATELKVIVTNTHTTYKGNLLEKIVDVNLLSNSNLIVSECYALSTDDYMCIKVILKTATAQMNQYILSNNNIISTSVLKIYYR